MELPNPKSHRIPLEEAVAQTRRYRSGLRKGGFFLRKEVDELLAQKGCAALRFYYGRDKEGYDTLMLVGVNQDGNEMTDGVLMELHFPCPPFCNDESPLNSDK